MKTGRAEPLEGVERTMLLPLWGRYTESTKENGLLKDEKCVTIVEQLGIDLADLAKGQNPGSRLAWVARAFNIDLELRRLLSGGAETTVVNLGCGLDTSFYRLHDRTSIVWYDVDLPHVIALRRELIGKDPANRTIAGSVLNADTYRGIHVREGLIVLAVGLLYYFSEAEVRRIFESIVALAEPSGHATLVIDFCSGRGVVMANKSVVQDFPGARMIWSAEGEDDLRALHEGFRVVETYPVFSKIRSLLTEEDSAIAELADSAGIMSFARLEIG
ncbi:MAG TPA: class I SAM-dependent methyltransferase [Spirochaetia bacterium]|nr:class I SAM-dependent methyltransferase [Spirochaetia bacterium]